jgi:hypothetical protein
MESQIILEGFNKSLEMHGVKFSKIIGDGDSSVYKKIKENKPYGPSFFIEKIECRNHLLRNYCGKLHELSRRSKVDMKIRHFLKNNILRFRSAVVGATKYWKQQNIENYLKIENLKTDILNGPKHIMGCHDTCKTNDDTYKYFCKGVKERKKIYLICLCNALFLTNFWLPLIG